MLHNVVTKITVVIFLFGLNFVFENVMFDIIYLFIYIFEKKYGLRKKRTMRMFLSNPNVNRLSINSKLENFPRRTRFDPKIQTFAELLPLEGF